MGSLRKTLAGLFPYAPKCLRCGTEFWECDCGKSAMPTPKPKAKIVPVPILAGAVKVTVSMGKTVNIGDYQTLRADYSETREFPEGTDLLAARAETMASVQAGLTEVLEVVETFK